MQATADPQVFKSNTTMRLIGIDILMKFLCEGYVFEVRKLLASAPKGNLKFFDCREFYFAMFN